MTKQQTLDVLLLLSALESWGFSSSKMLPDYLHERLAETIEALAKEVIES
jgi:hypothetical protein